MRPLRPVLEVPLARLPAAGSLGSAASPAITSNVHVDLADLLQPASLQAHERVRTQPEYGLPATRRIGDQLR
jgi:hypothetical protein